MASLIYPLDLTDKYYLSLSFAKYDRPDPFSTLTQFNVVDGPDSIKLPLPARLIDQLDLKWSTNSLADTNLGAATEAGLDVAAGNLGSAASAAALTAAGLAPSVLSSIFTGLGYGALTGTKMMPNRPTESQMARTEANVTGGLQGLLRNVLQRQGFALNPVLTQQFYNPEFKHHQFSWLFAPESAPESDRLKQIIDTIKQEAKPSSLYGGLFFGYPSMVGVKIMTGGKELYKILTSVITNVTVNYAPRQTPSFFTGTSEPVMVQLDLTLLEIILNTRDNSSPNGFITPTSLGVGPLPTSLPAALK